MKILLLAVALGALPPLQVLAAAPEAPAVAAPKVEVEESALGYLAAARAAFKPYDNHDPAPEEARRIVEENAAVFPLLQRAVELPLRFEKRNFIEAQFGVLGSVRNMARLLVLRSRVLAPQGDLKGALDSGLLCLALGIKMQEDGALISMLVGNSVEAISLRALQDLSLQLDADALRAAALGLGKAEARRAPFAVVLASEREVSLDLMRQMFEKQQPVPLGAATQQRLLEATRQAAEGDDALLSRPFALTRGLDFRLPDEDDRGAADEDEPPVVGANFDAPAWAAAGQKSVRPVKQRALLNRTRAQARLALLQAALATRAYQIEHKAPPASLQVLVPRYLPGLLYDPFDLNAPLQFKSDAKGVRIYSVGPDGMDDDGQPVEETGLSLDSAGDLAAPADVLKP